jgi:hypothetical protein
MSSSRSNTSNLTQVTDSRVVTGDQSLGLSVNHSNGVTVTTTDYGAVQGGLDLASQAVSRTMETSGELFAGALGAVNAANDRLADAYQQGQAGDQVQLKYAGFVVVGLAALAFIGTRLK